MKATKDGAASDSSSCVASAERARSQVDLSQWTLRRSRRIYQTPSRVHSRSGPPVIARLVYGRSSREGKATTVDHRRSCLRQTAVHNSRHSSSCREVVILTRSTSSRTLNLADPSQSAKDLRSRTRTARVRERRIAPVTARDPLPTLLPTPAPRLSLMSPQAGPPARPPPRTPTRTGAR